MRRLHRLLTTVRKSSLKITRVEVATASWSYSCRPVRARSPHTPVSARYWWTNLTVIEPSPTAEATRLIEPLRTSPAANTPGRFVSKRLGPLACESVVELVGSDRWPRDALVLAVYPVDNFDFRQTVTDHQCRFYAIPSFVEFVGAKYRL